MAAVGGVFSFSSEPFDVSCCVRIRQVSAIAVLALAAVQRYFYTIFAGSQRRCFLLMYLFSVTGFCHKMPSVHFILQTLEHVADFRPTLVNQLGLQYAMFL